MAWAAAQEGATSLLDGIQGGALSGIQEVQHMFFLPASKLARSNAAHSPLQGIVRPPALRQAAGSKGA
jgi:hypothetical protein